MAHKQSKRLAKAKAPVALLLPEKGPGEWDQERAELNNQAGLDRFFAGIGRGIALKRDGVPDRWLHQR